MEQQIITEEAEVNLLDIMDVVTQYRCKQCDFSCTVAQDIAAHYKSVHLANTPVKVTKEPPKIPTVVASLISAASQEEFSVQTQEANIEETVEETPEQFSVVEINSLVEDDEQITIRDGEDDIQVVQIKEEIEVPSVFSDMEIIVCGQCKATFTSIDECKQHMMEEHTLTIITPTEGRKTIMDTEIPHSVTKEISTQVRRKRKKRKLDIVEEELIVETDPVTGPRLVTRKKRVSRNEMDSYPDRKAELEKICRQVNEEYTIRCRRQHCSARFKTTESLEIHLKCHVDTQKGDPHGMQCYHCGSKFRIWRLCKEHLWKKHSVDTDLYRCKLCDLVSTQVYKLAEHMQIHSEDRPYQCTICDSSFKQLKMLREHRQTVHLDKSVDPQVLNRKCTTCNRTFSNEKCLSKHVRTVHLRHRPHMCDLCGYSTNRKCQLEQHRRIHSGEKPFSCDFCNFVTADSTSLRRHRLRHTGQAPYKCHLCDFQCIQCGPYKTHVLTKHPNSESIFPCPHCDFKTINSQYLEKHINTHEEGRAPANPNRRRRTGAAVQGLQNQGEGGETMEINIPTSVTSDGSGMIIQIEGTDGVVQQFMADENSVQQVVLEGALQQMLDQEGITINNGEPVPVQFIATVPHEEVAQ